MTMIGLIRSRGREATKLRWRIDRNGVDRHDSFRSESPFNRGFFKRPPIQLSIALPS
jgi:hypothetical protein